MFEPKATAPHLDSTFSSETSPVISGIGGSSGNLAAISALLPAPRTAPRNASSDLHGPLVASEWQKNLFAEFSLEKAIDLRWTLRDIQARRLKMSPVSEEDLRTLTALGLVEVRDEELRADAGRNGRAERGVISAPSGSSRRSRKVVQRQV